MYCGVSELSWVREVAVEAGREPEENARKDFETSGRERERSAHCHEQGNPRTSVCIGRQLIYKIWRPINRKTVWEKTAEFELQCERILLDYIRRATVLIDTRHSSLSFITTHSDNEDDQETDQTHPIPHR